MFRRVCIFTLYFALAAFVPSALAQAVYGSISGTVTDPSGGVLPGVTVTVTSLERKTVDTVVTNDSGQYVKDRLLPGAYEVKVELQGFKQMVYPGIQVNVDSQTRLDVALQVGALAEAVTVQGFSPLLKTDRADVATTFDSKQITDLPVLDRNFTKFVLLTPGTQQLGWQHAASENPQGSTQTMVNGQHFSGTGYQLDGTENRDPILGIIVINPTLESIAETKITSQNYDAEFGQATAGVVSVQTKSGGNQLRGSGFWFYQDDTLPVAQPVHAVPARSADRPLPAGDDQEPVRRIGRRQDRREQVVLLRRLRGDAQHRRRLAARDGADARRRAPATSAPTASTSSIRTPARRRSGSSSAATASRPAGCRRRRWRILQRVPLPNTPAATTAPSTTTSRRARRRSTATPSTSASTAGCATA